MKNFKSFPHLIHFFGPDGAGKSTQVDILIKIARQHGIQAQKCWVRAHHTLAFILWKLFVKIGFYRIIINPFGPPGKLPAVDRNRLLRFFWSIVELLGVIPILLRVRYFLLNGRVLVAERYILDTVVTIAFFLNDINFLRSTISKLLLRFIPRNAVFIFLDTDYETIYQRRAPLFTKMQSQKSKKSYGATPRCPVEPRVFIDFQRKAYKILAKYFDPLVIDTSNHSIEETSTIILHYLGLNQ